MSRRSGGRSGGRGGGGGSVDVVAPTPASLGYTYQAHAADLAAGVVASWVPRLGTGTLVQATGSLQPTNVAAVAAAGGRNSVNFADTGRKLALAATYIVPLAPCTVTIIGQLTGTGTYWWGQLSSSGGRYGRISPTIARYEDSTTSTGITTTYTPFACYSMSVAASGANNVKFYTNGVLTSEHTHTLVASGTAGQFILGDAGGPGFVGNISEFLTANTALSAAALVEHFTAVAAPYYGL